MEEHAAVQGHSGEGHLEWHTSYWPFVISFGVLFLGPLSFILHFVYHQAAFAVISLIIGIVLVVASLVGWVREGLEDKHHYGEGYVVWALPLFIGSEALLFIAFFAAYWTIRLMAPEWPPAGTPDKAYAIPIIMTIILVASSFTIHIAEGKLERHGEQPDVQGFNVWLIVTIILGLVFLGLSAYEWAELMHHGFTVSTNSYSTAFYSITGFHGSHVIVGLGVFICVLLPSLCGKVNVPFVKSASLYWHFVDIVWFFVVSQVYFW